MACNSWDTIDQDKENNEGSKNSTTQVSKQSKALVPMFVCFPVAYAKTVNNVPKLVCCSAWSSIPQYPFKGSQLVYNLEPCWNWYYGLAAAHTWYEFTNNNTCFLKPGKCQLISWTSIWTKWMMPPKKEMRMELRNSSWTACPKKTYCT